MYDGLVPVICSHSPQSNKVGFEKSLLDIKLTDQGYYLKNVSLPQEMPSEIFAHPEFSSNYITLLFQIGAATIQIQIPNLLVPFKLNEMIISFYSFQTQIIQFN